MTERGRHPPYWVSNGAPGGAAAYVTGRAHSGSGKSPATGILPRVRLAGRKVRPAGLVSLLTVGGDPPWRLPALHPLFGETEKGNDVPDVAKQPAGGALAQE